MCSLLRTIDNGEFTVNHGADHWIDISGPDLKDELDLPEAIISSNTNTFHDPVRIGDRVRSRQILRSISEPKTTRLGHGRFWTIDVEYLNQDDALLGVESYTAFGYRRPTEADS